MSDDVVNLAEARAVKTDDCREWTPLDLARAMLRDIESGKIKPSVMVVHYHEPQEDGGATPRFCAAGVTNESHCYILNVALYQLMMGCFR